MMGFAALYPSYIIRFSRSLRVKLPLRRAQGRRSNVERARALVLVLAVRQHGTAVPAKPRRERLRLANGTALLIARKIDDVAWRHYEFLNHGILAA
jgi:hypothetical protein